MTFAAPSLKSRIEALLPLIRASSVGIVRALSALAPGGMTASVLRPLVGWLERAFAYWLFLSAFQRVARPPRRPKTKRPRSAPPGFRRVRARADIVRRLIRMRRRPSLAARLAHLLNIAAHTERAITRLVKRMQRFLARGDGAHLIAIAPPALVLISGASAPAPMPADSS